MKREEEREKEGAVCVLYKNILFFPQNQKKAGVASLVCTLTPYIALSLTFNRDRN